MDVVADPPPQQSLPAGTIPQHNNTNEHGDVNPLSTTDTTADASSLPLSVPAAVAASASTLVYSPPLADFAVSTEPPSPMNGAPPLSTVAAPAALASSMSYPSAANIAIARMAKSRGHTDASLNTTRCVCGDNTNSDGFMICCETCEVWQHGDCVGVTERTQPAEYFCELCLPQHHIHVANALRPKNKLIKPKIKTVKPPMTAAGALQPIRPKAPVRPPGLR